LRNIESIKTILEYCNNQVIESNNNLPSYITQIFLERKKHILDRNHLLASLEIPTHKNEKTPKTFSIPKPDMRNRISISKPKSSIKGFTPEPSLDEETFYEIL
jgi:hypothetical protein